MTKNLRLLTLLIAGGIAALSGCSSAQIAPSVLQDIPAIQPIVVAAKPSLVQILWKMATTEKDALPKHILPYFGIQEVPPVKMLREDYGWFSFSHQPPRFVQESLEGLGVNNLGYHYNVLPSPPRERDRYSIQLISNAHCVAAEEVIAVFGQVFKRLPASIRTAAAAIPNVESASSTTNPLTATEKGGLLFEATLFDGRGSINFQFDSSPCAEFISINYIRKNQ